jgi:DNA-directed RNA polymerase specialized sigma24 family protein
MRRPQLAEAENALYQLFEQHSCELYWLAFLLTGDWKQSERAFTRAFELEDGAEPVFRQFMVSWARKLVIAASLATIETELRESMCRISDTCDQEPANTGPLPSDAWTGDGHMTKFELERAIFAIDAFPRCALLLTVFERLSLKDVASLLNSAEDVVKLAQSVGFIQLTRNIASGRGWLPITSSNIALSKEYAPARI